MDFSTAIQLYTNMIVPAIPLGFAFCIGNLVVNTFFNFAFGRKIKFE